MNKINETAEDIDILVYLILYAIDNTEFSKNLKIQKIIYIYEQERDKGLFRKDFLDYKAHNFGPYSQRVWNLIDTLKARKAIEEINENSYKLTEFGCDLLSKLDQEIKSDKLDKEFFKAICVFFDKYNSDDILKFVYHEYKEHLKNSTIIDNLIYEEEDYERIKNAKAYIEKLKRKYESIKNT